MINRKVVNNNLQIRHNSNHRGCSVRGLPSLSLQLPLYNIDNCVNYVMCFSQFSICLTADICNVINVVIHIREYPKLSTKTREDMK